MPAAVLDAAPRQTLFISKATPGDDAFVLWLAPRLEAAGYKVFADILSLEPGDRWRLKLTSTLQNEAIKMLLCCSNESLKRAGVDEEIGIAEDLAKKLGDPNFIIPLRLKAFDKVFGIGGLQYVDFKSGWATGLSKLLEGLDRQSIPKANPDRAISPEWEAYQKRQQIKLEEKPEPLTSNWIRVNSAPDQICFLEPNGPINHGVMQAEGKSFEFPAKLHNRGFFSFASADEMAQHFVRTGTFALTKSFLLTEFLELGVPEMQVDPRTAKNYFVELMRSAWEAHCAKRGLLRYEYSAGLGFHVSDGMAKIGQRIPWGRQGQRRNSMLRNIARNKVWEFGVSAIPSLYPFPHFRLKARVLFSDVKGEEERGETIADKRAQHRLRRSICSPWRNPVWLGRLRAFLELVEPEGAEIKLAVGSGQTINVDASLIMVTSPVSTVQASDWDPEAEETDESTLPPASLDEDEDA
jgi:hypothetical protein